MLTNFIHIDLFLVFLKSRIKLYTSQKSRVCHIYLSSLPSCYPLCKPQIWFFEKRASYFPGIGNYFMFTKRWQSNTVFEKLETYHSTSWYQDVLVIEWSLHLVTLILYLIHKRAFSKENILVFEKILELLMIQFHTLNKNKPGLLVLIDFDKAFDSVSRSFIYKAL